MGWIHMPPQLGHAFALNASAIMRSIQSRCTETMHAHRWSPPGLSLLLQLALLMSLAAGAHSRVVVFEAGSGEVSHADSSHYSGHAFVVMDQGPDGEVLETLMTVETWTGTASSLNILKALNHLLRPVSWVYQQLEAIDAMQQATISTFLMRHNEASLGGPAHTQAAALAEQQEDMTSSSMEDKLHHLGCQRFSAAMDEYTEGLEASSAALHMQSVVEMVERSNLLYALEEQLQVEDERVEQEPAVDVLHTSEMVIITGSADSDYEWDTLEVVTDAQKAYADYKMDKKEPRKHHLSHELQLDEKSPGPLLRGTSHWWSSEPLQEGSSAEDTGLLAAEAQARNTAGSRLEDQDSDDAFLPFIVELVADEPQHIHSDHTEPSRAQGHSADQQPHYHSGLAFEADGSDVYSFEQLPPLSLGNGQDWPVLVLLSLAASAVAVAFVVSWMQLQAVMHKGRHVSVPVMVKHKGRLVWGMVVVSEEEVGSSNVGYKDTGLLELHQDQYSMTKTRFQ